MLMLQVYGSRQTGYAGREGRLAGGKKRGVGQIVGWVSS